MGIWLDRVKERAKRFAMILFFGFERIVFRPRFLVASAVFFPIVSTSSFLQKHTTCSGGIVASQVAGPHRGDAAPAAAPAAAGWTAGDVGGAMGVWLPVHVAASCMRMAVSCCFRSAST